MLSDALGAARKWADDYKFIVSLVSILSCMALYYGGFLSYAPANLRWFADHQTIAHLIFTLSFDVALSVLCARILVFSLIGCCKYFGALFGREATPVLRRTSIEIRGFGGKVRRSRGLLVSAAAMFIFSYMHFSSFWHISFPFLYFSFLSYLGLIILLRFSLFGSSVFERQVRGGHIEFGIGEILNPFKYFSLSSVSKFRRVEAAMLVVIIFLSMISFTAGWLRAASAFSDAITIQPGGDTGYVLYASGKGVVFVAEADYKMKWLMLPMWSGMAKGKFIPYDSIKYIEATVEK